MDLNILTTHISEKLNEIFSKDNKEKDLLFENFSEKVHIDDSIMFDQQKYIEAYSSRKALIRLIINKSKTEFYIKQLPENEELTRQYHGDVIVGFIYTPTDTNANSLPVRLELHNALAAHLAYSDLVEELKPDSYLKVGDKVNVVPLSSCQIETRAHLDLILEPYKLTLAVPKFLINLA